MSNSNQPPTDPSIGGRFKPGHSGNPKGRPRKAQSVTASLQRAWDEKVEVTERGRRVRIRKGEIAVKQLANSSASGDIRSTKLAMEYLQKAEDREAAAPSLPKPLTATDHQIVKAFLARIKLVEADKRPCS